MSRPRRFDWLFRPQMADADLPLSSEARFAEALAELPAVERSALALSEIGGLDTNEIAERLGTDPAVVHKLLTRARESMRTTLAVRGRRGLSAVLPLQNWWQTGASAQAMRAAGLVAAAVVAPSVVIGGAAADTPRAAAASPAPSRLAALDWAQRAGLATPRARPVVAVAVTAPKRQGVAVAAGVRRPARSAAARPRQERVATPPAHQPSRPAPPATPAVEPDRPQPAPAAPARPPAAADTVARIVHRVVSPHSLPLPTPVHVPEIALPPDALPPVPSPPAPLPELPELPQLPPVPVPPLP